MSACTDLGCASGTETPGICGTGSASGCPTTEAGQCDDGVNNDAWQNSDTDCDDPACATDPACLVGVVVTVPFDLNPGDEYRLLFVTSSVTDATSADIGIYNAVVAADAAAVPELDALGTTFTAVASTPTVDARDNTATDPTPVGDTGVPIYLVNGVRFADDYDSLWTSDGPLVGGVAVPDGSLAFIPTSSGNSPQTNSVWTGSNQLGVEHPDKGGLGDSDGDARRGVLKDNTNVVFPGHRWITSDPAFALTTEFPLYGMSEVLTVPCVENITQGTMYTTIQSALDAATSGDVIELGACTFFEDNIVFPNTVDVTLRGAGRDLTTIDGGGGDGTDSDPILAMVNSGQTAATLISDLTLRNGAYTLGNNVGAVKITNTSAVFRNVSFLDNSAPDATGLSVAHVRVDGSSAGPFFDRCIFAGGFDASEGVFIDAGTGTTSIINCLFADNSVARALRINEASTVELTNCTVSATGAAVAAIGGTINVFNSVLVGTLAVQGGVINTTRSLYVGATGDNINGLPTFVDAAAGDYRLAGGSLGIDAAEFVAYDDAGGDATDLNGDPRFHGCVLDIGAYENQDAGFVPVLNVTQGTVHATIQSALDAAVSGDVIELGACTFNEWGFVLINKDITIRGQGRDQTIIDAAYNGRVFRMQAGDDSIIEDLTIRRGVPVAANGGAAVQAGANCNPVFRRVDFRDCDGTDFNHGAVDCSGTGTTMVFEACRFLDNFGAGRNAYRGFATTTFLNCLFAGNSGGASTVYTLAPMDLVNCTFADNTDATAMTADIGGDATARNCVFDTGNPSGTQGTGITSVITSLFPGATGDNIDGVSTFVDAPGGDYRLAPGSLGIDAADITAFANAGGGATDLNGDPRTHDDPGTPNTGSRTLTYLDMGAYEFQGTTVLGECNGDGKIDLDDYDDFETCLLGPGGGLGIDCNCFDFDHDGDVTLADFGELQVAFTGEGIDIGPFPIGGLQVVPPNASPATGIGSVTLSPDGFLDFNIVFDGLVASQTVAHFHGPAMPGQNAGVQFPLPLGNSIKGSVGPLDAQQQSDLLDGLWYVNIHSVQFPGGEIRGQVE